MVKNESAAPRQLMRSLTLAPATSVILATIIGTFRNHFRYIYGFHGNNSDLLLLGTQEPLE